MGLDHGRFVVLACGDVTEQRDDFMAHTGIVRIKNRGQADLDPDEAGYGRRGMRIVLTHPHFDQPGLPALIGIGEGGQIGRPIHHMHARAQAATRQLKATATKQRFGRTRRQQHFAIAGKADDCILNMLDQVTIGGDLGLVVDFKRPVDAVSSVDDHADADGQGNARCQRENA